MNIVEPYAKLLSPEDSESGLKMLRRIEWCARISHRSENKQTDTSWQRFLQSIVFEHGDFSVVEHSWAIVDFLVDRGITHEIVRHRLFSYTQESTRFVNYEKKLPPSFIVPFDSTIDLTRFVIWKESINRAEAIYKDLIKINTAPQIARSVFPNALASRLVMSGNLRNWRHFLLLRTSREAHPQMKQVTIPLLQQFKERIPLLFDDIEPEAKQSENMRKMR